MKMISENIGWDGKGWIPIIDTRVATLCQVT